MHRPLVIGLTLSGVLALSAVETHAIEVQDSAFAIDLIHVGAGIVPMAFGFGGRLYAGEKPGRILVFEPDPANPGQYLPPVVFASLESSVNDDGERGLLGLSIDFTSPMRLYAFYSYSGGQRVVRFTSTSHTQADGPPVTILDGLPNTRTNHNGGDISYSGGTLYIALGDDAVTGLVQSLDHYNGKILRVGEDGAGLPDNPFYDGNPGSVASRIWGLGCRNPFRFTFHSGAMYVSENGNSGDRVSRWGAPGVNGGWPGEFNAPNDPNIVNLVTPTTSITGIAITSSSAFVDPAFPASDALYVANWRTGVIKRWRLAGTNLDQAVPIQIGGSNDFVTGISRPAHLTFGFAGLYVTTATQGGGTGRIYRLRFVDESAPPTAAVGTTPDPAIGPEPLSVDFEDLSSSAESITSRLWQFGDGATSSAENPSHTFDSAGNYTVTLTVTNASGLTDTATIPVTVNSGMNLQLSGTIYDGRQASSPALPKATEVRLYQFDGVTPLSFQGGSGAHGNVHAVPAGGQFALNTSVELTDCGVVISAGESQTDGLHPAFRAVPMPCNAETHVAVVDFRLSDTALGGRLADTLGNPAHVDLGVSIDAPGELLSISGGRDFLSPIPPSGVPHRIESDALGYYYIPVPFGAGGSMLFVDVVADTNQATYLSTTFSAQLPGNARVERDLVLGLQSGGASCDAVPGASESVDYDQVQAVFDVNCVGCHSGLNPNAALDLSASRSYEAIVNVPSGEVPGSSIVAPGASELSFLWEKINCSLPQVGVRMPTGIALSPSDQAVIRDWIDQGAKLTSKTSFARGDVNADGWRDISDVVAILRHLFDGQPASCEKSADTDDSGILSISDAMALVQWFFAAGPPAPDPLECGPDPTADDLGCETFGPCAG